MNSPIKWYGGKGNLTKQFLLHLPKHDLYVEVFGGGASLLFAKEPVKLEVYNDINIDLVNFFRVLRDKEKFNELKFRLALTPYSREEFYIAKASYDNTDLSDIERAYYFYIGVRMAFNADLKGGAWGYGSAKTCVSISRTWFNSIDKLDAIYERVKKIQVDNRSYKDILKAYDGKDTFFYCDPPYHPDTLKKSHNKPYKHNLDADEHVEFIDSIKSIKGKMMISGYRTKLYDTLLEVGWKRIDFNVCCSLGLGDRVYTEEELIKLKERVECIWMNY